jgi:hypothetical protein
VSTFAPTPEQSEIQTMFRTGGSLKVRAGAGTGKTSTLIQLGDILEEQGRIGLYIAFNKSIATEAQSKFTRGVVTAKTAHALAFQGVRNSRHADLLEKMGGRRIPFWQTQRDLRIRGAKITGADDVDHSISGYMIARHVLKTVQEFCKTSDVELNASHVPPMIGLGTAGMEELVDVVLPAAKRAWKDLLDPRGNAISFSHDHYLKLWSLSNPIFGREGGALFVDEAQDISPVLAGVIDAQTHLQRIVVGDSAQAIYGFTGAVNYMGDFQADHEGRLTQSWRFGTEIATAANELLAALGDDMRMIGNPNLDSTIDRTATTYDAILTRTNGSALDHVMAAQLAGRSVSLMGDQQYAIRFCEGAEKLINGEEAGVEDLAAFERWDQVVEYSEDAADAADWKVFVKLIEDHGVEKVRAALENIEPNENKAELIVATAHKSKGREFGRVKLDNSMTEALERARTSTRPGHRQQLKDELMLNYVAITRAQHVLNPGDVVGTPDTAHRGAFAHIFDDLPAAPIEIAPAAVAPIEIEPAPIVNTNDVLLTLTPEQLASFEAAADGVDVATWILDLAVRSANTAARVRAATEKCLAAV